MKRPGEIGLGAVAGIAKRRESAGDGALIGQTADAVLGEADTGADIGRQAVPGAEVEIAVEQGDQRRQVALVGVGLVVVDEAG